MRGTFKVEKPEEITVTLTMTATLEEWLRLADELGRGWPSDNLRTVIRDAASQAKQTFYAPQAQHQ